MAGRDLYISLLTQVCGDFEQLRWRSQPVSAQLVHKATNAEAEGVIGMPTCRGHVVAIEGAGHREPLHRRDQNGKPRFRPDPIVDVDGNPIVNSLGEGLDFIMPAFRTLSFAGRTEDVQHLCEIGNRAGSVILGLLDLPQANYLRGWSFSTMRDLWWALLFEMAWAKNHPLLVAERRLWLPNEKPNSFVPYDLGKLRALAKHQITLTDNIPPNWLIRLPEAWVSEIDNMVLASMDAANCLLRESASKCINEDEKRPVNQSQEADRPVLTVGTKRRFAVALSFPGEHRDIVDEVAHLLEQEFESHRILYDKFHEAELACPNLDLKLQQMYRDDSDVIVVFLCGPYNDKEWCGLEWRAIRDLMKDNSRPDGDVMLLRLDDKPVDGLLSIDGYLDISEKNGNEIANAIMQRWRQRDSETDAASPTG